MLLKTIQQTRQILESGVLDDSIAKLCGGVDQVDTYRQRLLNAIDAFGAQFGTDREIALFSAPGRTELGGNHTDHQRGHVLAASVNLDIIAVAARRDDNVIQVQSEGFPMDVVSLDELEPKTDQKPGAAELIRGVAARFGQLGCSITTGFDAYTTSQVMKGSGLSSSAAFEVLIGNICNAFYGANRFSPVELAEIGQYAENVYFQKPCGLMDQMASSVGGAVAIDFAEAHAPVVQSVSFDFSKTGYALCIVDTGGNHADLTAEYAAIPAEMHSVAAYFGKEVLSEVPANEVLRAIPELRKSCGDRAVLRAMHYYREDRRAQGESDALERGDFEAFLHLVENSGQSSYCLLQNVYPSSAPQDQPVSIALAVGSAVLGGRGAIRVHGGGFGGTIQAFVPTVLLTQFREDMEKALGVGCCHVLQIRPVGGTTILI
ncbi:galactokinase family protein [Ruminococcus sp.]|uniref:galactokinase n=1 Tax=Ruminococcus sp. TaxID=41978 RepID=UPI0025CD358C|nr:galactokinase family protein [Ruminococcus sp.]